MSKRNSRDESHSFEVRLQVLQYVVLATFVALGVRFWVLQVANHQVYLEQAENNRIREIPILAPRGAILDRNETVLVDNTPAFNIVVTPDQVHDRDETVEVLVANLGVDRDLIESSLSDPRRPRSQPIIVKQNASPSDRQWVAAHAYEHPEIDIEEQPQRVYKYGKLAAHVLGYVGEVSSRQLDDMGYSAAGYKRGDIIGQDGLEKVYDKALRGKDGKRIVMVDSRGRPIVELDRIPAIKGQDIVTTLDVDIQKAAEEQFDQLGQTGAAIVMDPRNGEILAMASAPSFDPNVFARNVISAENRAEVRAIMTDRSNPLFNKATHSIYPTGSTWKILIATAALEEGVIDGKSRLLCGGGMQLGNRFVRCMGSHGAPDLHTAIVRSCDGFFYRLGLKMGLDMIHDWILRFGVGKKTGIDLPSEERGIIPDREWKKRAVPRDPVWRDFDTVMASVGQGSVAIPPLQLLRAQAGIMMGGEYHTPHLLKEAKATQLAPVMHYEDDAHSLALSPRSVEMIRYGIWGVVNEGGTGHAASLPGLDVGGKTGTAQVIAKEKARLKEHQDHAWFIGFAPVKADQKPEIGAVVISENAGQGGRASAPKVRMIFAEYFSKKLGRPILPEVVAAAHSANPTPESQRESQAQSRQ